MAECERLNGCAFFQKIKHLPKTAEHLANTYCHGDNSRCARLCVISSGLQPPPDLFPNEMDRARLILSEAGKSAMATHGLAAKKASNKG
jgi:hypothetical protein